MSISIRPRTTRAALVVAGLACLAPMVTAAPAAHAAPAASAASTTYAAAPTASWPYRAPGVSATITVTQVAETVYKVSITGTAATARPTTIPVSSSSGLMVPAGPYRMASGHGTMNLTNSGATFTFDKAYLATYQAPFTFSGEWVSVVTTAQTSTQTITVGGRSYSIGVKAPATGGRADGAGRRIMQPRTYEIDNAVMTSPAVVKAYFAADDNGSLSYRELAKLYKAKVYRNNFREQFIFRTVMVPKGATPAEELAAINASLPHGWPRLTSTARQAPSRNAVSRKASVQVVTAWELDVAHGAKPVAKGALAWGPRHNLVERYAASSNHR